ncbi:general transcriptional corepressor trfA-like [Macrobrachium nipponense]|uniref:general transcriptional corepressor trfA-like n=1 Tax=Macrobrachium nipponense TaxID=159736 RepID=UPI0030C80875
MAVVITKCVFVFAVYSFRTALSAEMFLAPEAGNALLHESRDACVAKVIKEVSSKHAASAGTADNKPKGTVREMIKNEVYRAILLQTFLHHREAHQQLVGASKSTTSGGADSLLREHLRHVTGPDAVHKVFRDLTDNEGVPVTLGLRKGRGSYSLNATDSPAGRVRRSDKGMMYIPVGGTKKVQCPTAADAAGSSLIQMAFLSIFLTVFSIVVNVSNNINNNNNNNNVNTDNNLANNNAQLSLNVNNAAQVNVMLPPPIPGRRRRRETSSSFSSTSSPFLRDTWKDVRMKEAALSLDEMLERLIREEEEEKGFATRPKNPPARRTPMHDGNPSGREGGVDGSTTGRISSLIRDYTDKPLSSLIKNDTRKTFSPSGNYTKTGDGHRDYTGRVTRPIKIDKTHTSASDNHAQKTNSTTETRAESRPSPIFFGRQDSPRITEVGNNSSKNSSVITSQRNFQTLSQSSFGSPESKITRRKAKKKNEKMNVIDEKHPLSPPFSTEDQNSALGRTESDATTFFQRAKTPEISARVMYEMRAWLLRGVNSSNPSCVWLRLCQSLQEEVEEEEAMSSWVALLASFVAHRKESERSNEKGVTFEDFSKMALSKQQCGLLFPLCSPSSSAV